MVKKYTMEEFDEGLKKALNPPLPPQVLTPEQQVALFKRLKDAGMRMKTTRTKGVLPRVVRQGSPRVRQ